MTVLTQSRTILTANPMQPGGYVCAGVGGMEYSKVGTV